MQSKILNHQKTIFQNVNYYLHLKLGQYVRESTEEVGQLVTTNRIENVWRYAKKEITGKGDEEEVKKQFYTALYFRQYITSIPSPAQRLEIFLKHWKYFYSLPLEETKERNYVPYRVKSGNRILEL